MARAIRVLLSMLFLAGCLQLWYAGIERTRFDLLPAPLPDTIRIVPPHASVPMELAAFTGKWTGKWEGQLDHVLVVEEVHPPHALVIYAYGAAGLWGIKTPRWTRERGQFERGTLILSRVGPASGIRRDATATYRLRSDGYLEGSLRWSGGTARILMTRVAQ